MSDDGASLVWAVVVARRAYATSTPACLSASAAGDWIDLTSSGADRFREAGR